MEVIFGDMSNTIDTLLALSVTLEAVTAGKHELNESGYNVSDAWSQLAEGKVTLIEYLENEYHLGHYKSPLIKRLELALMAAEDKINAAFKDANGDVYHDWKAVAGLCQEWISTINGYYRYNPEPGTMAHAFLKMMKEPPSCDKLRKPTHIASGNNLSGTATGNEFRSCLLIQDDKKDELLKKLHLLIDGKKGKAVALVIRLCVELGLMSKPTFGVLQAQFGDIGHHSNYDKYYRNYPAPYVEQERQGMMSHLEPFKGYLDSLE
jgi:hypothetical protein